MLNTRFFLVIRLFLPQDYKVGLKDASKSLQNDQQFNWIWRKVARRQTSKVKTGAFGSDYWFRFTLLTQLWGKSSLVPTALVFFPAFFFNFNLELKLWTGSVWALNWVVCVCVAPENRGPAPIEKWVGNTTKIQKFPGSARCDLFLTASGKESIIFFSGAVKKYFMVPMSTKWVSGRKIRPKGRNRKQRRARSRVREHKLSSFTALFRMFSVSELKAFTATKNDALFILLSKMVWGEDKYVQHQ